MSNDSDDTNVRRLPFNRSRTAPRAKQNHGKPVNEGLIDALREALNAAQAGDIVSGGIFATHEDGTVSTDYSSTGNMLMEIAAVSRLLHRLHLAADDAAGFEE